MSCLTRIVCRILLLSLSLVSYMASAQSTTPTAKHDADRIAASAKAKVTDVYGKLPLAFEANRGQTDPRARFISRGQGYSLFLSPTEAVLALRKTDGDAEQPSLPQAVDVRMQFIDSNPQPKITGLDRLPGRVNYFVGNDPAGWVRNVPAFSKVNYQDVYPGIDLVFYGNQTQLEYDFVLAPGTDPKTIRLAFQGVDRLNIDAHGDLFLKTANGELSFRKPVVYQETDGARREISGSYVLFESETGSAGTQQVGFQVAAYDAAKPLVIDPVLVYSTYLGGSKVDRGTAIAVDSAGNAYVAGYTKSLDFPTQNSLQGVSGGFDDAFVVKLNASGTAFVYATYLGGNGGDSAQDIAVDGAGNAYVVGSTSSGNFPVAGTPFQGVPSGGGDAFVTKIDASGASLIYSTYLGGENGDSGTHLAVDGIGNAYILGRTFSYFFPTSAGAYRGSCNNGQFCATYGDLFVSKLNASGSALVYSTYLGGSQDEFSSGIAVDDAGSAYVTGHSYGSFPGTAGAFRSSCISCQLFPDAFVAKLDAGGTALVYSTYLGGTQADYSFGIAVDAAGNAYVAGKTDSSDFPTVNAYRATKALGEDCYVTKLNATGSALIYSTHLGGGGNDACTEIAIDISGAAYVTGWTDSNDFPTLNAFQGSKASAGNSGYYDAFVTKLSAAGSTLEYSTYLGGNGNDAAYGIAVDNAGNAYVTGETLSITFPTVNPIQSTNAGGPDPFNLGPVDAFVAKISASGGGVGTADVAALSKTSLPNPANVGDTLTYTITVKNFGPQEATQVTVTDVLNSAHEAFISATPGQGSCSGTTTVICSLGNLANGASAVVTIQAKVLSSPNGGSITNRAAITAAESDPNLANNEAVVTTTILNTYTLTVTKAGNGSGTVTSTPAGISCGADCTEPYAGGAVVSLTAAATSGSVFAGWSGDADCADGVVTLDAGKSCTATFSLSAVTGKADLALTLTASPSPVKVNTNLTYTLVVSNTGPATASGVTLTDTLSSKVILVSAAASQGSCSGAPLVTCNLGALASGSQATVTLVVRPFKADDIQNKAQVKASQKDPNTGNNKRQITVISVP